MEVFQDQAEWYTLELAAALATQRAARSTAAEYLAWCPAHGHGGMRALMATTPPGTEHDALRMLRVGALGSEWLIQIMVLMACRVARYITSTAQHILLVCYQTRPLAFNYIVSGWSSMACDKIFSFCTTYTSLEAFLGAIPKRGNPTLCMPMVAGVSAVWAGRG